MRIRFYMLAAATAALCMIGSCGHADHDGHDHEGEEKHEHEGEDEEIIFTPEQAKAAGLEVETVKAMPFESSIKVSGKILPATGDLRTVSATASGIANPVGQLTDGAAVRAGQALYSINAQGTAQGDSYAVLKVRYEAAKREYERAKALLDDKIITQAEYTALEEAYRTAAADLKSVSNRAAGGNLSVTSPIAGYLVEQLVQPGQYVEQGTPLATVSQNRRLQLRAEVPHQYASQLQDIASANFVMPYNNNKTYSLDAMNGHKISDGKVADAASGYIPVIFEFDNTAGIVPGTYVETYLLSRNKPEAISVPTSALTEEQGLYFVYIRIDDHGYRKQEVTIGSSNGQRVEILSGLKAGDEVVTKAVGHLKLAANTGQVPEGHSHNH